MLSRRASLARSSIQPAPNSLGKGGSAGAGEEKVGRWRRDLRVRTWGRVGGEGGGALGLREPASLPSPGFPLQQPAMPSYARLEYTAVHPARLRKNLTVCRPLSGRVPAWLRRFQRGRLVEVAERLDRRKPSVSSTFRVAAWSSPLFRGS